MKALVLDDYNAPFRLAEVARPTASAGELLVEVKASGVNPLDTKIRAGKAPHARQPLPAILGVDLAGIVREVGAGVSGFRVGDEVYGMTGGVGNVQGSLAEYAAVDARLVALKPSNISMREAAALPLVAITAWEGLIDQTKVQTGDHVLVIGRGGVGQMVAQIAEARGALVTMVASSAKEDDLALSSFEVVFDTADKIELAFAAVKRGGRVVSALGRGTVSLAQLALKSAGYYGVFTLLPLLTGEGRAHHGDILREITKLVEAGKLLPQLDSRTFNLGDVAIAHTLIENRKTEGKLVITVP